MNLDNLVKRGYRPWLPSSAASDIDVWHEYEVPLVGTFDNGGDTVLFALVGDADPDRQVSVWAYTVIGADEAQDATFDSSIELTDWVRDRFTLTQVLYAVALDFEILNWSEATKVDNIHEGAVEFIGHLLQTPDVRDELTRDPKRTFELVQAEAGVLVDLLPAAG